MELNEELRGLLREPSICYLTTLMPDGSPQVTQVWVDTDGEHVLINSVQGHVKTKNIARDPRGSATSIPIFRGWPCSACPARCSRSQLPRAPVSR